MARRRRYIPLNVFLNGRLVGRLRRESSGAIDFQYHTQWLDWQSAIPVSLSLPLREDRFIGAPVTAVFDNLLPDNEEIRSKLAERSHAEGDDAYSLLAAVGRDCVGALQFLPDRMAPAPARTVKGRRVNDEEISGILGNLERSPLGIGDDEEFRISIAGAQEKTALLYWRRRWMVPHGTTATTHILKPQIGHLESGIDLSKSVENEHLCMQIVSALGIPTARTEIRDFAGRRALVVERFDRRRTRDRRLLRLPQEDCCQALSVPPTRKYESEGGPGVRTIMKLLQGSDTPERDQKLFLKAQIVFWLLAATDGHAKNFSIHLGPGGRFQLAPLYDVVSAQPSIDAGQIRFNRVKMAMAIGSSRHYVVDSIVGRHFLQMAGVCGIPERMVSDVLQEVGDTAAAKVDAVLGSLPKDFPQDVAKSIARGISVRLKAIGLQAAA
jgi:serine/threonine-protein kinase HipA